MNAAVADFIEAIENIRESPAEIILEKAKEAFTHSAYSKNVPAHRQSKWVPTSDIAGLRNRNSRFIDKILHRDGSVTLITSDNFYLRFYNL